MSETSSEIVNLKAQIESLTKALCFASNLYRIEAAAWYKHNAQLEDEIDELLDWLVGY